MKRVRNWIGYIVRRLGAASGPDYGLVSGLEIVPLDHSWGFHPDDAYLLAAAPELMEACEAFERYFDCDHVDYGRMNAQFKALQEKVRGVLQKARGQACPAANEV